MGYLIGEIWLWLLIAFVIGLVIGWLIWGRGRAAMQSRITDLERQLANARSQCDACEAEKAELAAAAEAAQAAKAALEKDVADAKAAAEASTAEVGRLSARIVELEKARDAAKAAADKAASDAGGSAAEEQARLRARIRDLEAELAAAKAASGAGAAAAATESTGPSSAETGPSSFAGAAGSDTVSLSDAEGGGSAGPSRTVTDADKPSTLDAPQGAKDDLKLISGVGPKLEGTLNELGIYHFWQIARWTGREIAWMDDFLSFKGRIERDKWIDQAKILAEGGDTEFSRRNR